MRLGNLIARGGVTILVALSGAVLAVGPAYSHSVADGRSAGDNTTACVRPFAVSRTSAVDAGGNVVANRALAGYATAYTYATGTGDEVREIVPPAGWSPLQAADAELRAYGFPPRPVDARGRATWEKNMAGWKRAGNPEMCLTAVRAAVTNSATTGNWAGGMAVNGSATVSTFTNTDGRWSQPSFDSYCGFYGTGYAIWSGLGGWNSGRLIQSGVDNSGLAINGSEMFWEMLSPQHPNGEVRWTDVTVPAGHQVQSYVSYDASGAFMWVADLTTGVSHSVLMTSYQGQAASGYYDGTTADFITEAPSSGGILPLTRVVGGQTYYGYATVNGQPIANFWSWRIDQVRGDRVQQSGFDGIHAWNDFWQNCT